MIYKTNSDTLKLVRVCRAEGLQFILGCDANALESAETNKRGKHLLKVIMAHNLDFENVGNQPTFLNTKQGEIINVILGVYISN